MTIAEREKEGKLKEKIDHLERGICVRINPNYKNKPSADTVIVMRQFDGFRSSMGWKKEHEDIQEIIKW